MKPIIKMMLPLCVMAVVAMPSIASASSEEAAVNQAENAKAALQYKVCYNTVHNQDCSKEFWQQLLQGQKPGFGGIVIKPGYCPGEDGTPQPPNDDVITPPTTPEQPPNDDVITPPTTPEQPPNDDVITPPTTPEQPPVEEEKPEQPEKPSPGDQLGAYQQKVVDLVNQERKQNGLAPLAANKELSKVAEVKAADMRDNNYFSHTSPTYGSPFDMMKQFGITYRSAGENIAKGQKSPEAVMNGWMNSEGHRANILSSNYSEIGVGYVTDSKGMTYWVQMFRRP